MGKQFPRGMPISIQGDRSLDSGLDEKEALLLRFIGKNGEPVVMLLDLAELDLKDSVDGSSPDALAQCSFKCYERALDELDKRLGQHLNGGTWRKALVNSPLDGASV
jgi:hypothetical protein